MDGLDEVPDARGRRQQIKQAVQDFSATFAKCRFLITSRTYAYQRQDWKLEGFVEVHLLPFTQGQIFGFIDAWYAHMVHLERLTEAAARDRAQLLRRIRDLDAIGERREALRCAREWLAREHDEQIQLEKDRVASRLISGPIALLELNGEPMVEEDRRVRRSTEEADLPLGDVDSPVNLEAHGALSEPAPENTAPGLARAPQPDPVEEESRHGKSVAEAAVAADPSVMPEAAGVVTGGVIAAEQSPYNWHPIWSPFNTQGSAEGFARRLTAVTGFELRAEKEGPHRYRAELAYQNESDLQNRLAAIEAKTGLSLDDDEGAP